MSNDTIKQNDIVLNDDGKLYFNPYNPNNIEITEKIIQDLLFPHIGFKYEIHNIELFKRAGCVFFKLLKRISQYCLQR